MNAQVSANFITMQNIINCYIRETGLGEWQSLKGSPADEMLVLKLKSQPVTLFFPVKYRSVTGRHLFKQDLSYQIDYHEKQNLDLVTLLSLLLKEVTDDLLQVNELMIRVLLSYENMNVFIETRQQELEECYKWDKTFLQAEQSLLIGHQLHPTPKSRQGILPEEESVFAPELKGEFQLHYFRAHRSLVKEQSAYKLSASDTIKLQLKQDNKVSKEFILQYCQNDDYTLIPMHPLQARFLLGKEEVGNWIQTGQLTYLGPQGEPFYPTSSVRTVYSPRADVMYKFSIPVKITNSLRVNKLKELNRGVEVTRLLQAGLEDELFEKHPAFHIIKDPAYVTLGDQELGFEVMIRENPFKEADGKNTTLLASLCQDHVFGEASQLANIIHKIASSENLTTEQVSQNWFKRYIEITLKPMMWLYTQKGIALEAHQQNSVIKLDQGGYPAIFYYRDNQGYYFMKSKETELLELLPSLNAESDTVCADEIAEERFRYYVFFNHLLGLVNAFGVSGLIDELKLLTIIREELEQYLSQDHTNLVTTLLNQQELPCKANFLTRVQDMDELVGTLEGQSVYVNVENPLYKAVGVRL
ncbi:IucA/IucC family protein [Metabacillus rhizolycopersici]|uniref:IucA/IucC family siderophore biosynthesis protein n=1 Tax=Metabacillus rhizolycopersici TaxID=2875709 RepID=A0ABS7UTY4_9BACI|nr:IucA/IucC family protein [Metabacillus rhizolycopersici]MBZ5751684.1 IucA/IucC family siderophore biosynthesis protein [Metabacillus rhizolycopersici]